MYDREVEFLKKLDHPNIIKLLEAKQDVNEFVIKLEYGGQNIWDKEFDMWQMVHDISLALEYLKSKKILHRDVKPDNILVDTTYKLIDFNMSSYIEDNVHRGTLYYLAPEHFKSKKLDYKSDVWALAISAIYAKTKKHPFESIDL